MDTIRIERPDGIVVRNATKRDAEQILELNRERNGTDTVEPVEAWMADRRVGHRHFIVAADGKRVVSTLVLLPDEFRWSGIRVPLGRPEYVATHEAYGGRGLVRDQMNALHRASAARGDLAQIITGIPYFYRQFGYGYGNAGEVAHLVRRGSMSAGSPAVRAATVGDAPGISALFEQRMAGVELTARRSLAMWRRRLGYTQQFARCLVVDGPRGSIRGFAVVAQPVRPHPRWLGVITADTRAAARALIAHAGRNRDVSTRTVDPLVLSLLAQEAKPTPQAEYGLYIRVPDPAALLRRIRPVLDSRLQRSRFAKAAGRLLVGFYRFGVALRYADGRITRIEREPRNQNPAASGGIAVPPDHMPAFLFGRYRASDMEHLFDDVEIGRRAPLADVLFPKVRYNLLLFD